MDQWHRRRAGGTAGTARRGPTTLGLACTVALVGGCAQVWAFGEEQLTETCISWAVSPDEESRVEVASVVIDGRMLGESGQRQMFGTTATVWDVEVVAVTKGELSAGDVVEVASTPQTCSGGPYPDDDPLGGLDGTARLYLHDSDFAIAGTEDGLALISPFDGIGDTSP